MSLRISKAWAHVKMLVCFRDIMVMDGDGSWGQVCLASRHCSSLTYCRFPGIEIVEGVEKEMKRGY